MPQEMGWTGGPWALRVNGVYLRVVHGEHKTTVADGIVSEANARLIAAAPDLYEALADMRSFLAQHVIGSEPYMEKALAALTKARGE